MVFKLIGVLFSAYVLYAVFTGSVVAKSGPGSRIVVRSQTPGYFWTVVVIYAALSVALLVYF